MHVHDVLVAYVVAHLANRFKEWQRLDVADRSADLDDANVGMAGFGHALDVRLDLVGDVRNHLYGGAEILAAPFLFDYRVVDLPCRDVVRALQIFVDEALVVPEIQIGLRPVLRYEDLSVLVRVHRPRVHVDVRIELLDRNAEAARFQEPSEGGGGDALAERTHNAPGEEDILRH